MNIFVRWKCWNEYCEATISQKLLSVAVSGKIYILYVSLYTHVKYFVKEGCKQRFYVPILVQNLKSKFIRGDENASFLSAEHPSLMGRWFPHQAIICKKNLQDANVVSVFFWNKS